MNRSIYILTRYAGQTYVAQTLSPAGKVKFRVSCTAGADRAAVELVRKYYKASGDIETELVRKDADIPKPVRDFRNGARVVYDVYRAIF